MLVPPGIEGQDRLAWRDLKASLVSFDRVGRGADVAKIVRSLRRAGIKVGTHSPLAPAGIPFAIEREARAWNVDLIVIGSRRLSDFASVFLSGLDHQMIHRSEQPVLVAE